MRWQKLKVDIIIRCKNNWSLTKKCISSIQNNTEKSLYRLIVVNDGSVDDTLKELDAKASKGDLFHIAHTKSLGAVSATNSGLNYILKNNPASYIIVFDNDTEILTGNYSWLTDLIKYFEEDESIGILGCVTDNVIGLQNVSQQANNKEPKFLVSFAWMMSLKCVVKCGLFDTRYDPGNFEDLDYSITATRAGFKLKVAKDVFVTHHCHQTFNQMGLDNLVAVNENKGLAKWGERIYYSIRQ